MDDINNTIEMLMRANLIMKVYEETEGLQDERDLSKVSKKIYRAIRKHKMTNLYCFTKANIHKIVKESLELSPRGQ